MTKTKTIGVLCIVLLVTMLIATPLSNHAFASHKTKTSKDTQNPTKTKDASDTTKTDKDALSKSKKSNPPKEVLEKRLKEIEARHKNNKENKQ